MSTQEIFLSPDIKHKNIHSQNLNQHLLEERIESEISNRRIVLSDISYEDFLREYEGQFPESEELFVKFHTKESFLSNLNDLKEILEELEPIKDGKVSIKILFESFVGHIGQLEEDVTFDGIENANETIERIKIIKRWIGKKTLSTLKENGRVDSEFTLEEEIDYLLLALHVDYQTAIKRLDDSQSYIQFDHNGREFTEGYGPTFEPEHVERLVKLSEIGRQLKKGKNQLSGLVVYY